MTLVAGVGLSAHDLFFRLDDYFVAPNTTVRVSISSGTFAASENAVSRDRLADLSMATSDGRQRIDQAAWSEQEPMSVLTLRASAVGTIVLGAALRPRVLALDGPAFNDYLKEEGLDEILAARATERRLAEASRERYSKYLKAVVQIGDVLTDSVVTEPMAYPAEIVPLANTAALRPGATLRVRCLVNGRGVANHVVFAGGLSAPDGATAIPEQRLVTDAGGIASIAVAASGRWYVRFVHMTDVVGDREVNYESKWATLTFGVR